VALLSLLAPRNRNNSPPRATPTSRSDVLHADRQGEPSKVEAVAAVAAATETEATVQLHARCILRNVPHVVKTLKCPSNPVVTDPSTVQIVTAKPTQ